jgi:CRISPR-associated protein Cmr1
MIEQIFNVQVITPLFLGGANPRVQPELRAASIRGVMRYWYRALVGGSTLVTPNQIGALREQEAEVFGTTESGSPVTVFLPYQPPEIDTFRKDRAIRTREGDYLPTGKDYLLWSMAESGRPNTPRYQAAREYIKPGFTFDLVLRSRLDKKTLDRATIALWLMGNLGALGTRANRGAGSLQIVTTATNGSPTFKECRSLNELVDYLRNGLQECLVQLGGAVQWQNRATLPPYDVLSPANSEIWLVAPNTQGWNSYLEALNGIGAKMRDYRSHRNEVGRADHDAVLHWLENGGRGPQIRRAAFGLPIPFRYSEGGPNDVIQAGTFSGTIERRASPLHIKITRLADGHYVGILTLFKSIFLENAELKLQSRKWTAPSPQDYGVIQQFIQTFEVNRRVNL